MNRDKDIFNEVQEIFRDVFDNEGLVVTRNTSPNDLGDWDSLRHINLLSTVEKEFGIKFTLSEMILLKNVGEIMNSIEKKKLSR